MFQAPKSPFLVPFDGTFRTADAATGPPKDAPSGKQCKKRLEEMTDELSDLQRILYAHDHHAVLLVFQAMDAAGKDSTIRAVMTGVNPAGCQVFSFKKPSDTELDHDFLWRTTRCLPERGRIGIFNRSYYEEVLVVRVHPGILEGQRLPHQVPLDQLWSDRCESIADHEKHLARNGTIILKFWLNVSRDEQRRRFLSRLNEPEKHWKFAARDVAEREHWDSYMCAYEEAMNATSHPHAPWFAIPADDKPFMRLAVAEIIVQSLESLGLRYPEVDPEARQRFDEMRRMLDSDAS